MFNKRKSHVVSWKTDETKLEFYFYYFFFANQSQRLIKRRHLKLQGFTQTSHLPAAYSTSDLSVSIVVPNNYVFHKCMGSVDSLSSTVLTT